MNLWQTLLVIDIVIAIYDWVAYAYIEVAVRRRLIELEKSGIYKPRKMSFPRIVGYIFTFVIGTIIFLIPILNLWVAYGSAVNKERCEKVSLVDDFDDFLERERKAKTKEDLDKKNILNKEGDK